MDAKGYKPTADELMYDRGEVATSPIGTAVSRNDIEMLRKLLEYGAVVTEGALLSAEFGREGRSEIAELFWGFATQAVKAEIEAFRRRQRDRERYRACSET